MELNHSSYGDLSIPWPAIMLFGELVFHYLHDLFLQYNHKHNETRAVSDTVLISVTGQAQYATQRVFSSYFWMNMCKCSAQVGMESSFGDCTRALRHWLIPSPAGLYWPMGWGLRNAMLSTTIRSKNRDCHVTIKVEKRKWRCNSDCPCWGAVTTAVFSECHGGRWYLAMPLCTCCNLIVLDQKLSCDYKLRQEKKGGVS